MSNKAISVYAQALQRQREEGEQKPGKNLQLKSTRKRDNLRNMVRDKSSGQAREYPSSLPTREEIQEFSFRLRDELKVKVQAEVPYQWQKELEQVSRKLDVKKLELYRFIFGEFLEKVRREKSE